MSTTQTIEVIVADDSNYIVEVGVQGPPGGGATAGAYQVPFTPYHTVTGTDVQTAIEQLADQLFKSDVEPTENVEEGDLWYDTTIDKMKVYINGTWTIVETDLPNASINGGYF